MDATDFRKGLEDSFADEVKAVGEYARLARMAPEPWLAWQVEQIRQDEARHAWVFANMLQLMGWWPVRRGGPE